MKRHLLLGLTVFASIIASTLGYGCVVTDYVSIGNYTITCYERPAGINGPGGDFERDFKFVMLNSVADRVDRTHFLAVTSSNFCQKFIAINNTWHTINVYAFEPFGAVKYMDLSDNRIVTINREAFGNLRHLKFLNLSSNSIESFSSNSFQMQQEKPLQELDLSNNKLKKIGGEFNELPNLKILHLQNNRLSYILDDAFLSLKNLTYLDLQHNLLSTVGSSLLYLENLETLNLSDNYFTKLSADNVSGLISIVNFNISHNELKLVESNCFSEAEHLQAADFSFNNIEITIDESMFKNNHELSYLNFYFNKIVGVHENAFKNCDLHYLNFGRNNINGNVRNILSITRNESSAVLLITGTQVDKTTADKANRLQKDIQSLHKEIDNLKSKIGNLTAALNKLAAKLDRARKDALQNESDKILNRRQRHSPKMFGQNIDQIALDN